MTTLYLDFGNTRLKWRVGDGEIGVLSYECFEQWFPGCVSEQKVQVVVFASVLSDSRQSPVVGLMKQFVPEVKQCVVTEQAIGVRCAYQELCRLGIDRWLAVLAAWSHSRSACVVADLGTAATIDVVDDGGQHLGGYIVSGLHLSLRGLLAGTDNIRPDPAGFESANLRPGVNTAEAVYHGALHGLVALIESSYQNLLKSFPKAKLILAGGDAALVGSHLSSPHERVDDLVFEGMQLLEKAALLIDA